MQITKVITLMILIMIMIIIHVPLLAITVPLLLILTAHRVIIISLIQYCRPRMLVVMTTGDTIGCRCCWWPVWPVWQPRTP
jgi:hypothetical protein